MYFETPNNFTTKSFEKRFQFKTYNTIISLIYVQTFVKVYFFELSGVSNIVPVLTIASLNDNK